VIRLLCGLWLLFAGTTVHAAELTHFIEDRHIGARVQALAFPESLRKDLRSGLTNRLLMRMNLQEGAQSRAAATVQIALQYDLWDERFRVELVINGMAIDAPGLRTVDEAVSWLSDLRLPRLFEPPANAGALTLKVEALLNPIERERMERIREWVTENSSYVPLDSGTKSTTSESSSNAMFNRIFEQYAAGKDVAAQWRHEVVSAPFSIPPR
jgi:hypothetical protein